MNSSTKKKIWLSYQNNWTKNIDREESKTFNFRLRFKSHYNLIFEQFVFVNVQFLKYNNAISIFDLLYNIFNASKIVNMFV